MLPDFSVPSSIVSVLSNLLIKNEGIIHDAYSSLLKNAGLQQHISFKSDSDELKDPFKKILESYLIPPTTKAIDLPVLLSTQARKPTIVVCAMDSLPPEPESEHWQRCGVRPDEGVQLWIPFSLCEPWSRPKGSMSSNLNFFKPLFEEFNVYVTDIYKLFFRTIVNGNYIKSNQLPAYQNLASKEGANIHKLILSEEIDVVKPSAIVTLGSASTSKLFDLSAGIKEYSLTPQANFIPSYKTPFDIPHFPLPHISNAANGAKTKFMKQFSICRLNGQSPNSAIASHLIQSIQNILK